MSCENDEYEEATAAHPVLLVPPGHFGEAAGLVLGDTLLRWVRKRLRKRRACPHVSAHRGLDA